MKLQRFIAANAHKAMEKIHAALGDDAMIYSSQNFPGGVVMLAGLSGASDEKIDTNLFPQIEENALTEEHNLESLYSAAQDNNGKSIKTTNNNDQIEKLNAQLQKMGENVEKLANQLNSKMLGDLNLLCDEKTSQQNLLFYYLGKLGFRGLFCYQFISNYLSSQKVSDSFDESDIEQALLQCIKVEDAELIDKKNICALIGPTGVGKTTTIAKLAKRYISRYGSNSLGLIATDYKDVTVKNHLQYYSQLLNVDFECASNANELSLAIHSMRNKKLILIDTYGVSQRDTENLNKLLELLESQKETVATYLTLPCNVQEPVLDEIARGFNTKNLRGCILTKQDECISIATAMSVCLNYKLKIAYICNGQNINKDIDKAAPDAILQHIISGSINRKKMAEVNLMKNSERVIQTLKEGGYDSQPTR